MLYFWILICFKWINQKRNDILSEKSKEYRIVDIFVDHTIYSQNIPPKNINETWLRLFQVEMFK